VAGVALSSPLCGRRAPQEVPQHGREQPFRQGPRRRGPARDRRRRHGGRVLPDEADHAADRVRIVGQRYRAARRDHRLPEWHHERGVRLEPGIHPRLGPGTDPGGAQRPHDPFQSRGGTAVGLADRHREPAGHEVGRAVADDVAVHRAGGGGEAEQRPPGADHRAQRLRAGRPVEQEQHVAFEAGE
jgi:hypothetical protein